MDNVMVVSFCKIFHVRFDISWHSGMLNYLLNVCFINFSSFHLEIRRNEKIFLMLQTLIFFCFQHDLMRSCN